MNYIVERVMEEQHLVRLERADRTHLMVELGAFGGASPKEGDVVEQTAEGYCVNEEQTHRRRTEMIRRTRILFQTEE